jgi:hypothetical protein
MKCLWLSSSDKDPGRAAEAKLKSKKILIPALFYSIVSMVTLYRGSYLIYKELSPRIKKSIRHINREKSKPFPHIPPPDRPEGPLLRRKHARNYVTKYFWAPQLVK